MQAATPRVAKVILRKHKLNGALIRLVLHSPNRGCLSNSFTEESSLIHGLTEDFIIDCDIESFSSKTGPIRSGESK